MNIKGRRLAELSVLCTPAYVQCGEINRICSEHVGAVDYPSCFGSLPSSGATFPMWRYTRTLQSVSGIASPLVLS